jgi:hypothetical protein
VIEKFPLLYGQRRLLWVALAFALAGAVIADRGWMRMVALGAAAATAAAAVFVRLRRPVVVLDDRGYAVTEGGREKLRVEWSEVKEVRVDPTEHAAYVDCGDPKRNLLVPPRRGYAFTFSQSDRLYQRITESVPDRLVPDFSTPRNAH